MRRRWLSLLALIPSALTAQMLDVQPGARVRLTAPGFVAGRVDATIVERKADSITVITPAPARITLPLSAATLLEVSNGRSRLSGTKKGLLWGVGVAVPFAVMTMFDTTMTTSADGRSQMSRADYVGTMALGGAMIGAVIGAFVGSQTWSSYSFPGRVAVSRSGTTVGASFHF